MGTGDAVGAGETDRLVCDAKLVTCKGRAGGCESMVNTSAVAQGEREREADEESALDNVREGIAAAAGSELVVTQVTFAIE